MATHSPTRSLRMDASEFQFERLEVARQQACDRALERRVMSYLTSRGIEGLDSIRLSVVQGNLLLRGTIYTVSAKQQLCECCRHVAGVLNVCDRLLVVAGDSKPRKPR